jgi:hypothetical protein
MLVLPNQPVLKVGAVQPIQQVAALHNPATITRARSIAMVGWRHSPIAV